jgi:ABC-type dipeptide/oligopeptide/nickel transport system permease component
LVAYSFRRLGSSLLTMILTTMITFAIIQLAPGGPAILLDDRLTQDDRDQIRRNLGLDQPIPVQYFLWSSALVQGDLGTSYLQREPVTTLIAQRFPNTVLLAGVSLALAIIVGIPMGILAATRANSLSDYVSTLFSVLGISVPPFWLGILMMRAIVTGLATKRRPCRASFAGRPKPYIGSARVGSAGRGSSRPQSLSLKKASRCIRTSTASGCRARIGCPASSRREMVHGF